MVYVIGALVSDGSQGESDADQLYDQKEMAVPGDGEDTATKTCPQHSESSQARASLEDAPSISSETAHTFFLMIIHVHTNKNRKTP